MDRRAFFRWASAAGGLLVGGCANRPSYEDRMAVRCAAVPPILFLAEDPLQVVVKRSERGFPDVIRYSDGTLTFYEWVTFTFMHLTEVCQTSPIGYLDATRRLGLDVGTFRAGGRGSILQAMDFDHVGFDPRKRDATLRAAEAAGARYLVVGKWLESSWDYYDIAQMTVDRLAIFSTGRIVSNKVSGVLAAVEFHVHDVTSKLPVFRKRYSAFEEDRIVVTGPGIVPTIHSFEIRKAIVEGLVADIALAMQQPASLQPSDYSARNLQLAAASPVVVADRRSLAEFVTMGVTLETIDRRDRFTRFELRVHNQNSRDRASIAVRRTKLGTMVFAKSASGQVYTTFDDSRPPAALDLRPGEAGMMSITLQNDLGPMGNVSLYIDLDIRSGRASGSRRIVFPSLLVS